ncbi:MAG TPA: xanthine dehydrogenase family protein subunit M [Actinomycetes bacterium]|nr:xanthine dehydrogenase family protein subunit M [Actinomycetes bacterium]
MVAAPFRYERVSSFEEAVRALHERGEDAKVIAGGQSLVPMMNLRIARPEWLIDVNPVGAGPIEDHGGYLRLPALTRHRAIEEAEVVRRRCPILAEAAAHVGNVRTRTRGTVGGSLAHADPAAELPCVAVALGAEVTVLGRDGARAVAADDLLVSYLTTTLAPDEVVVEVRVPTLGPRGGWSFLEMSRRSSDWMVVGVAALVELDAAGAVTAASVAVGGVAERAWLVPAEALADLLGAAPEEALLARVAERAAAMLRPEDDVQASGEYRRRLAAVLGRRALAQAVARAGLSEAELAPRGNGEQT